jgi:hypothetical protein
LKFGLSGNEYSPNNYEKLREEVVVVVVVVVEPSAGAASLKSRRAPCTSPGPNVLGYVHGVGAAAGNSDHVGEEYMYILMKEYCTRYGRAGRGFNRRIERQNIAPAKKFLCVSKVVQGVVAGEEILSVRSCGLSSI